MFRNILDVSFKIVKYFIVVEIKILHQNIPVNKFNILYNKYVTVNNVNVVNYVIYLKICKYCKFRQYPVIVNYQLS